MTAPDPSRDGWSRALLLRALFAGALALAGGAIAGEGLMRARGAVPVDTARPRSAGPAPSASPGPAPSASPGPAPNASPGPQASEPETPASAEALALLSPLAPGKEVGGCVVSAIVEHAGAIRVRCRAGSGERRLCVARAEDGGPPPPATAGPFAVYYASGGSDEEGVRAARALAEVLAAHTPLEVPAWMKPLRGSP